MFFIVKLYAAVNIFDIVLSLTNLILNYLVHGSLVISNGRRFSTIGIWRLICVLVIRGSYDLHPYELNSFHIIFSTLFVVFMSFRKFVQIFIVKCFSKMFKNVFRYLVHKYRYFFFYCRLVIYYTVYLDKQALC